MKPIDEDLEVKKKPSTESEVKRKILHKMVKSVPDFVWKFCASISLLLISISLSSGLAHIPLDKFATSYLDIVLERVKSKETPKESFKETKEYKEMRKQMDYLLSIAHESKQ